MSTEIRGDIKGITEYLEELDDRDLVAIHNEYCESVGYADDKIYVNDEDFFECYFSDKMSAIRAICYGEYTYTDDYVVFNGYANLDTFTSPYEYVDIPAIARDILENPENYYGIELEEVVDERFNYVDEGSGYVITEDEDELEFDWKEDDEFATVSFKGHELGQVAINQDEEGKYVLVNHTNLYLE